MGRVDKITLTSLDVTATEEELELIFGRDFKKIKTGDAALSRRGVRWYSFFDLEIHLVPVASKDRIAFEDLYKEQLVLDRTADDYGIISHVGISVPDVTTYISIMKKNKIPYSIRLREDGTYQVYLFLSGDVPSFILELESRKKTLTKEEIKKFS